MADRYPVEQFPDLRLPGFGSEATIWDVVGTENDWQPVLSLSIYSRDPAEPDEIDVLTAIRADDTETHPHVISTPTGRIPAAFQAPLVESRLNVLLEGLGSGTAPSSSEPDDTGPGHFRLDEVSLNQNMIVAAFAPNPHELPACEDPVSYVAHEPLARKLGLGDALQPKKGSLPIGTISLSEVVAGFSYAADDEETGTPLWEPLMMYGGVVLLHDRALVPGQTAAYRKIGWTRITDFIGGHMMKRPEMLIPTIDAADEATVCIRGLCLTTTGTVTTGPNFRAHLGIGG